MMMTTLLDQKPSLRRPASLIATPLYLSESVGGLADRAGFLDSLSKAERGKIAAAGRRLSVAAGEPVFVQGEVHTGMIAALVGSTRQWVTMMLKRFRNDGVVSTHERSFRILRSDKLEAIVPGDAKVAALPSRDDAQSSIRQQTKYA